MTHVKATFTLQKNISAAEGRALLKSAAVTNVGGLARLPDEQYVFSGYVDTQTFELWKNDSTRLPPFVQHISTFSQLSPQPATAAVMRKKQKKQQQQALTPPPPPPPKST
jgi:hypothetical protein